MTQALVDRMKQLRAELQQIAGNPSSVLLISEPGSGRTLTRKLKEAITAFKIEALYTKDEIFEAYLNLVPYGGNVNTDGFLVEGHAPASDGEVVLSTSAVSGRPSILTAPCSTSYSRGIKYEIVVLPAPPFWLITATVRMPACSYAVVRTRWYAGTIRRKG